MESQMFIEKKETKEDLTTHLLLADPSRVFKKSSLPDLGRLVSRPHRLPDLSVCDT